MVNQADRELIAIVDSIRQADGVEFAQMSCGSWRQRRNEQTRTAAQFGRSPKPNEKWLVRLQVFDLRGTLLQDIEGYYTIKHFDLPIAVEEAVDDAYEGETIVLYAPWYTAYGMKGSDTVKPYTNVRFVVTLKGNE